MRRQNETARKKLESALTTLLNRAASYSGIPGGSYYDTQNLLEAARGYARAFRRVETRRKA